MFERIADHRINEIFRSTKQEDLKLEAALKGFFADERTCAKEEKEVYLAYIKRRARPAAGLLAGCGEREALERLFRDGILTRRILTETARIFSSGKNPAAWIYLMAVLQASGDVKEPKETVSGKAARWLEQVVMQVYAVFPYMDAAIAGLQRAEDTGIRSMGTDGTYLRYNPQYVCERFEADRSGLARQYLHILLHCVFQHWNLTGKLREEADETIEKMIEAECHQNRAAGIAFGTFDRRFPGDEHGLWLSDNDPEREQERSRAWALIGTLCGTGQGGGSVSGGVSGGSFSIGADPGTSEVSAGPLRPGDHDYRTLLRQFAVPGEELQLDPDSFDYIWYTLGLERYGDLPLIEPLEYTEGHKLEELVIAIDTSGSCTDETVRRFLEDSYAILARKENFFDRMNVYVIQCDCVLQQVIQIRCAKDWRECAEKMTVFGRAGTDFRPVFRYVDELRKSGEMKDLKCLLYFTDGDGIFPTDAPDYETVFVLPGRTERTPFVPGWARVVYMEDPD